MLLAEAARRLGVTKNQLKYMTTKMEGEGYEFKRDGRDRLYTEDDLVVIAQRRGWTLLPATPEIEMDDAELLARSYTEETRIELLAHFIRKSIKTA